MCECQACTFPSNLSLPCRCTQNCQLFDTVKRYYAKAGIKVIALNIGNSINGTQLLVGEYVALALHFVPRSNHWRAVGESASSTIITAQRSQLDCRPLLHKLSPIVVIRAQYNAIENETSLSVALLCTIGFITVCCLGVELTLCDRAHLSTFTLAKVNRKYSSEHDRSCGDS